MCHSVLLSLPCIVLLCHSILLSLPCTASPCHSVLLSLPCIVSLCHCVLLSLPCIVLLCHSILLSLPYIVSLCRSVLLSLPCIVSLSLRPSVTALHRLTPSFCHCLCIVSLCYTVLLTLPCIVSLSLRPSDTALSHWWGRNHILLVLAVVCSVNFLDLDLRMSDAKISWRSLKRVHVPIVIIYTKWSWLVFINETTTQISLSLVF
jgi:hypothetical protein